jgi:1,4-dihydroxy-6-naphthoate synthase
VETLNQLALHSELDVTKVSFHTLGFVRDNYVLLRSGGALGKNCGPLLIASQDMAPMNVAGEKIAIPGMYTTAHLLLKLYLGSDIQVVAMPFDQIFDAVQKGVCRAGLIIHEGRFTYYKYGLNKILDLGEWWETATGLPIPVGAL